MKAGKTVVMKKKPAPFKACVGCPNPSRCKAMGGCMKKGK